AAERPPPGTEPMDEEDSMAPEDGDPIARGVDLGYKVVDAYLREGQKAAQRLWSPYVGGVASATDMQHRMAALFRQTADLATLWFDLSGAVGVPGMNREGSGNPGTAGPFGAGKK